MGLLVEEPRSRAAVGETVGVAVATGEGGGDTEALPEARGEGLPVALLAPGVGEAGGEAVEAMEGEALPVGAREALRSEEGEAVGEGGGETLAEVVVEWEGEAQPLAEGVAGGVAVGEAAALALGVGTPEGVSAAPLGVAVGDSVGTRLRLGLSVAAALCVKLPLPLRVGVAEALLRGALPVGGGERLSPVCEEVGDASSDAVGAPLPLPVGVPGSEGGALPEGEAHAVGGAGEADGGAEALTHGVGERDGATLRERLGEGDGEPLPQWVGEGASEGVGVSLKLAVRGAEAETPLREALPLPEAAALTLPERDAGAGDRDATRLAEALAVLERDAERDAVKEGVADGEESTASDAEVLPLGEPLGDAVATLFDALGVNVPEALPFEGDCAEEGEAWVESEAVRVPVEQKDDVGEDEPQGDAAALREGLPVTLGVNVGDREKRILAVVAAVPEDRGDSVPLMVTEALAVEVSEGEAHADTTALREAHAVELGDAALEREGKGLVENAPEPVERGADGDSHDDGEPLREGESDALGDCVPERENTRLALTVPLVVATCVPLMLALVQPVAESEVDITPLPDATGEGVGDSEGVVQTDADALRKGLDEELNEPVAEREGKELPEAAPKADEKGVTDTLKLPEPHAEGGAEGELHADTVALRDAQDDALGNNVFEMLCDRQGDALGVSAPVRESTRLALIAPLAEPVLDKNPLDDPTEEIVGTCEGVAQTDADELREGLDEELNEPVFEREGNGLPVTAPEADKMGVVVTLKLTEGHVVGGAEGEEQADAAMLRELTTVELGDTIDEGDDDVLAVTRAAEAVGAGADGDAHEDVVLLCEAQDDTLGDSEPLRESTKLTENNEPVVRGVCDELTVLDAHNVGTTEGDEIAEEELLCEEQGDALNENEPVRESIALGVKEPQYDIKTLREATPVGLGDTTDEKVDDVLAVTRAAEAVGASADGDAHEDEELLCEGQGGALGDSTPLRECAGLAVNTEPVGTRDSDELKVLDAHKVDATEDDDKAEGEQLCEVLDEVLGENKPLRDCTRLAVNAEPVGIRDSDELTVLDPHEVGARDGDGAAEGELLCDRQGDALCDNLPVREKIKLALAALLAVACAVLLLLTLVQPLAELEKDDAPLTDPHRDNVDACEGVAQFDANVLREGLDDELIEPTFEREGKGLPVAAPTVVKKAVADAQNVIDPLCEGQGKALDDFTAVEVNLPLVLTNTLAETAGEVLAAPVPLGHAVGLGEDDTQADARALNEESIEELGDATGVWETRGEPLGLALKEMALVVVAPMELLAHKLAVLVNVPAAEAVCVAGTLAVCVTEAVEEPEAQRVVETEPLADGTPEGVPPPLLDGEPLAHCDDSKEAVLWRDPEVTRLSDDKGVPLGLAGGEREKKIDAVEETHREAFKET